MTRSGILNNFITEKSTIVDLLQSRSRIHPERRVYTFLENGETENHVLTYEELDKKAKAVAAHLQSMQIRGERAVMFYPPVSLDFIVAFLGCLYAGVIAVPAYPPGVSNNINRVLSILEDAEPALILTTSWIVESYRQEIDALLQIQGIQVFATDEISDDDAGLWEEISINRDDLAFLQYTSGSTSAPKGVMVSHENILHNEMMSNRYFGLTEEDIGVGWLPLYHDMGLIGNVLQTVYVGGVCIMMSTLDFLQKPMRWLRAISRYNATTSGGPNFAYEMCRRKVTEKDKEILDLSSWRVAFNGAEPVSNETMQRFYQEFKENGFSKEAFSPVYGLAEATLFVTGGNSKNSRIYEVIDVEELKHGRIVEAEKGDPGSKEIVSLGEPPPECMVRIVDPETMVNCAPETVGEVWISGSSVAQGYWNKGELTEHTFNAYIKDTGEGPFLRTGDLGYFKKGELYITGRLKDLIIIRGRNYYPQDIEETVTESHQDLRPGCCAAFSIEADNEEKLVIVAEVHKHLEAATKEKSTEELVNIREEIAVAVRKAVAEQFQLHVFDMKIIKPKTISVTSSGKIQRGLNKKRYLETNLELWGE